MEPQTVVNLDHGLCVIKNATLADARPIAEIFISGIHNQYDSQLPHRDEIERKLSTQIEGQDQNFKFWICADQENNILAWLSILPFHSSPHPIVSNAYGQCSLYVHQNYRKNGVGRVLLSHALEYCSKKTTIKYVLGIVLQDNHASMSVCRHVGFMDLGTLPKQKAKEYPLVNLLVYEG